MAAQGRNLIPTFPARLRELCEAAGFSPAELAGAAGTSESAVYALQRGERSPSLELAGRLADALGVSVDALRSPPGSPFRRSKKIPKNSAD